MKKRVVTTLLGLLIFPTLFACAQAGERQVFAYYANGIAQFREDEYWGLINEKGEVILPAEYSFISPRYSEGLAIARSESRTTYIDESGNVIIDLPRVAGSLFKNGYAWIYDRVNGLYGFLATDKSIRMLNSSVHINYAENVSDGLAFCVRVDEGCPYPLGCYINVNGDVEFDLPLDPDNLYEYEDYGVGDRWYSRRFNNGFALFYYQGKMHLINKQGDIVGELPALLDFMDFSFGPLSVARDPETRLYGFMNIRGEYIVPPVGRTAYPVIEDRGWLEIERGFWRCYDETGQLLFEIQCDSISPFYQGYAVTRTITRTTEFVEYDENHQPELSGWAAWGADPIESDLPLAQGYDVITTSVTTDIIDRDGNVIINDNTAIVWRQGWERAGYNQYMPMSDGLIAFEEDGKYGFVDIYGELVIAPQFEKLDFSDSIKGYDNMNTHFIDGYARVEKDSQWYLINTRGEIVSPGGFVKWFYSTRDE